MLSLKGEALKILARREHSRAELAAKLARKTEREIDDAEIIALLDELETKKLLSDARAAEQLAHQLTRRYGARAVAHRMQARGIDADITEAWQAKLSNDDLERARKIWQRKFKEPPHDANERAKQMRFLQGRGFSLDVIRNVLDTIIENSDSRDE